jgi:hypothetical protein
LVSFVILAASIFVNTSFSFIPNFVQGHLTP